MTFDPTLPPAETTADGKTRVECERMANGFFGKIKSQGESDWRDGCFWSLDGTIRAFQRANEAFGEEHLLDLRNVEPAPVDWEKPVQFDSINDRCRKSQLEYLGVVNHSSDKYRRLVKWIDSKGETRYGRFDDDGEPGDSMTVGVINVPPAPRTMQVEVAGARLLNGSDGIAIIDDQTIHFIDLTSKPPRPVACHIELESIGWRGFKISDPWQTITLDMPE